MIYNTKSTPQIEELIAAWQQYIAAMGDWQKLIEGVMPKQTYCGPIYEPASPLDRPNESFALSDMREVKVAEPHYHTGGETETYFVISGSGLTVVCGEELQIKAGDVIVTPPETAHFTIPRENLVMIVINTPPFNPDNNIHVDATKPEVKYDHEQYKRLAGARANEKPENIPQSLMHSVVNDSDTAALFSLSDSIITDSIEVIKDSDLLSHIPITKEIMGLIKAGFAYRDRRYLSKLLSFLAETSKMSAEDKAEYTRKLDEDPKKAQEAGEAILDIIDKVTSREKAIMIGKLVRAYGHESAITYDMLMRMCEMVERAYLQDLQGVQRGEGYNESNLESVGIIKPIRHEDIEKVVKAAIEAAEYASPTIKDGLTPPPPREPKIDRSGLTEEGSNLQRILRDYSTN